MFRVTFALLFHAFAINSAKEYADKMDRYIISCRSTDFACFKLQYQLLRDNVLHGNKLLDVPAYEPFVFRYSDTGTCVKVTGLEESELVAINFDGITNNFSFALSMPVRIQQVEPRNETGSERNCVQPDKGFGPLGLHVGPLKKFTGNATVEVSYPFRFVKRKELVYMKLEEENLDVILDIPDLSRYDRDSELETKLFEWSEWAYKMVQHVDVADHTVAPYTAQVKKLFLKLPLERFILLYPSEEFTELQFQYATYILE